MNIANKITVLRILLVPIFILFINFENIKLGGIIALGIFIIAAITDKLDGYIARKRNEVTNFGKLMDPLADKFLVTSALIMLVGFDEISPIIAIIMILREFAVSGLRGLGATSGKIIEASNFGKIKTVIQIVSICLILLNINLINFNSDFTYKSVNIITIISEGALYLATIITVLSGIDYFYKNKKLITGF